MSKTDTAEDELRLPYVYLFNPLKIRISGGDMLRVIEIPKFPAF